MKIAIGKLKRLVLEAADNDDMFMGSRDEIDKRISSMDPDTVVDRDYVDEETGEIYAERGDLAKWCEFHPQHKAYREEQQARKRAEREAQYAAWDAEDAAEEEEKQRVVDNAGTEFEAAVEAYASNWSNFRNEAPDDWSGDFEAYASSVASDAADGFFVHYREWNLWANLLDMSKETIKSIVVDAVYEAMTKGSG